MALGSLAILFAFWQNPEKGLIVGPGAFWIALGSSFLVKFRKPDVRAKHVEYWTAKA